MPIATLPLKTLNIDLTDYIVSDEEEAYMISLIKAADGLQLFVPVVNYIVLEENDDPLLSVKKYYAHDKRSAIFIKASTEYHVNTMGRNSASLTFNTVNMEAKQVVERVDKFFESFELTKKLPDETKTLQMMVTDLQLQNELIAEEYLKAEKILKNKLANVSQLAGIDIINLRKVSMDTSSFNHEPDAILQVVNYLQDNYGEQFFKPSVFFDSGTGTYSPVDILDSTFIAGFLEYHNFYSGRNNPNEVALECVIYFSADDQTAQLAEFADVHFSKFNDEDTTHYEQISEVSADTTDLVDTLTFKDTPEFISKEDLKDESLKTQQIEDEDDAISQIMDIIDPLGDREQPKKKESVNKNKVEKGVSNSVPSESGAGTKEETQQSIPQENAIKKEVNIVQGSNDISELEKGVVVQIIGGNFDVVGGINGLITKADGTGYKTKGMATTAAKRKKLNHYIILHIKDNNSYLIKTTDIISSDKPSSTKSSKSKSSNIVAKVQKAVDAFKSSADVNCLLSLFHRSRSKEKLVMELCQLGGATLTKIEGNYVLDLANEQPVTLPLEINILVEYICRGCGYQMFGIDESKYNRDEVYILKTSILERPVKEVTTTTTKKSKKVTLKGTVLMAYDTFLETKCVDELGEILNDNQGKAKQIMEYILDYANMGKLKYIRSGVNRGYEVVEIPTSYSERGSLALGISVIECAGRFISSLPALVFKVREITPIVLDESKKPIKPPVKQVEDAGYLERKTQFREDLVKKVADIESSIKEEEYGHEVSPYGEVSPFDLGEEDIDNDKDIVEILNAYGTYESN